MPDATPAAPAVSTPTPPPATAAAPAAPAPSAPAAKPAEASKAAETTPAKPAEIPAPEKTPEAKPPEKPGEKPAEKPAEQTPEQKARDEQGRFVAAELKVPDGAKVDKALLDRFKGLAGEIGITTKQAQALLEMQIKSTAEAEEAFAQTLQRQRHADLETVKGDPQFGGAKFDETVRGSKSLLSSLKYGPAVSKKLEAVGLDCDPDFVRMFAEVRSLIAEDSTSSRLSSPVPESTVTAMSQVDRQAAVYARKDKEKRS